MSRKTNLPDKISTLIIYLANYGNERTANYGNEFRPTTEMNFGQLRKQSFKIGVLVLLGHVPIETSYLGSRALGVEILILHFPCRRRP